MASVPWLQSVGGPYSCSLEDLSGIRSLRLDNMSPWWPWRNIEGFQISVGHRRLGVTDFVQAESHSPGATDDSTAKVELHLFQPACGLPHNLFVMLSLMKLTTQIRQQLSLEVQIRLLTWATDCRGHQVRRDPTAYVCCETAARLG